MYDTAFDFMNIWTQSDPESEFKMTKVLLDSLDAVVQADSDLLSKMEVDRPIAGP